MSSFDRIAHDHILDQLGTFPAKGMIGQWLKAGVMENGRLRRTEDGVPQGGLCAAAHKDPNGKCRGMFSDRRMLLVVGVAAAQRCA